MQDRILQVFYGNDRLPYKDKDRTVHYPITGNTFLGSSNVDKIRFYVRDIGGTNNITWVLNAKLPNGSILYQVLSTIGLDSDLGEYYVEFSVSQFYTQLKGDTYIALNGCDGEVTITTDSETNIQTITATIESQTILTTGVIKFSNNYAPQRPLGFSFDLDQYQTIIDALSSKANIANSIQVVANITSEDLSGYETGQLFYSLAQNLYYKKTASSPYYELAENGILASNKVVYRFGLVLTQTFQDVHDVVGNKLFVITDFNNKEYLCYFDETVALPTNKYSISALYIKDMALYQMVDVDMTSTFTSLFVDTNKTLYVKQTTDSSKIYGTTGLGAQTNLTYGVASTAGIIVQRDVNGQIIVPQTPTQNTHATSKKYVDDNIATIKSNAFILVNTTTYPTLQSFLASSGQENYIYLYPINTSDLTKGYYQYIWESNGWLDIGTTQIDLSNYYTKEEGEQFENSIDNRVTDVENELSSVAQGSPKGVYATVEDLESAYPTGTTGIFVISSTGYWYYWNGSAWTSGGTYLASTEDESQNQQIDYLLSNKEKLLIKNGLYQYLDNDNIIDDYIWNSSGGAEPAKVNVSDFHCFPVFVLGKGRYCFPIAALYGEQSYIKNSNGIQKFSDAFPSVGYGGTDYYFDITEPTEMYISTTSSLTYLLLVDYNSQTSTINYFQLESHSKGYLKGDLNGNIDVGAISTTLNEIANSVDSQKEQIDYLLSNKENGIIENGLYQYLDNANIVDDYIWNSSGDEPEQVAASNFHCFPMFVLPKGRYCFPLAALFGDQSYIKNSNGVQRFSTAFPTVGYGGTDYYFDITEPTEMYISVTTSLEYLLLVNYNDQVSTFDWFNLTYHLKGYLKGSLSSNISVGTALEKEYYKYDQFFIKNCELTCNNDHLNEDGASAKYVKVNLGDTAKIAKCRIKFKNPSNTYRSCAAIIFTNYDTNDYIGDIVEHSIHCTFTQTSAYVEIFDNRVLTDLATYVYSTLSQDVEYEIGIKVEGSTLTIYLPNGTTQTITDSRFATMNGKYVIFESYNSLVANVTDTPTDNFEHPIFTGFFAIPINNGLALRDNFLRTDGALQVAPTCHVYNCFRNISSGDDRYDSAGNQILQ